MKHIFPERDCLLENNVSCSVDAVSKQSSSDPLLDLPSMFVVRRPPVVVVQCAVPS